MGHYLVAGSSPGGCLAARATRRTLADCASWVERVWARLCSVPRRKAPAPAVRYGPILGPLATGLVWGIWHLFYSIAPDGSFHLAGFALTVLELMLWAVVIAWLFERTNRSMAVALAIHAGGHLDKARVSAEDWRFKALTLLVLAVAAAIAARALSLRSSGEAC